MDFHQKKHRQGTKFECEVPECTYKCLKVTTLKRHNAAQHNNQFYQCHCCVKRFQRGDKLGEHLKRNHNIRLAAGQSKFVYIKDKNNQYTLSTRSVERCIKYADTKEYDTSSSNPCTENSPTKKRQSSNETIELETNFVRSVSTEFSYKNDFVESKITTLGRFLLSKMGIKKIKLIQDE